MKRAKHTAEESNPAAVDLESKPCTGTRDVDADKKVELRPFSIDNAAQPARENCRRNGSDLHRSFSPRELTDYRHCEGGATSWSQSRESNSRVHGYGPRRCTSTDCKDADRREARAADKEMRAKGSARVVVIFWITTD